MNLINKYFLFFLLAYSFIGYSQQEVGSVKHVSRSEFNIGAGFASVSDQEDGFVIYLMDLRNIYAYNFNKEFENTGKIEGFPLGKKLSKLIAKKSFSPNNSVIFSDKKAEKFGYMEFDFKKGITKSGDLDINLKGKRFIKSFDAKDAIYILSVSLKDPEFIIHSIRKGYEVVETNYDVSNFEFLNYGGRKTRPEHAIFEDYRNISGVNLNENADSPVSLAECSALSKLYRNDDQLHIVLDHYSGVSQLITFTLDSNSFSGRNFEKPKLNGRKSIQKTNSFLSNDVLIQIALGKDSLKISLKNILSGKEVASYQSSREEEPSFLNTPILQKNIKNNDRGLKYNQFYRKMENYKIAISLEQINGYNQITLGSWRKDDNNDGQVGAIVGAALFGMAGAIAGSLIDSAAMTPDFNSYALHATGKTVTVSSVLDTKFIHLEKESKQETVFDQMELYDANNKKAPLLLFNFNGNKIYGTYDLKRKTLSLVEFK